MSTTVPSWGHSGLSVDTTFVRVVLTEHMDFAASTFHGHSCHDSIAETVFISSVSTLLKLPSIFFIYIARNMKTTQPPKTCGRLITSHRKQTTRFKEIKKIRAHKPEGGAHF